MYTNCTDRKLRLKDYKAWSESCLVCKKVRKNLAVCFCNRLTIYLQTVCSDYCSVVLLVVEKEPEKQRSRKSKKSVNYILKASTLQTP
jgi:hypothetical protein